MRKRLLARAGGRCERCGNTNDLRATHIIAVRDGGSYEDDNGRLLCVDCDKACDPYAR